MIELPESQTLAKQLAAAFLGQRVVEVIAGQAPHGLAWFSPQPADFPGLLSGQTLQATHSWGGQTELVLGEMHLVFNDGVSPRYLAPDQPAPAKQQLFLRFEDGSGFYCTVRMYGGLVIYPLGQTDSIYYRAARDKPSPLEPEFDREYFQRLVEEAGGGLSTKALLATEQRIPGLGNGVLQDILFEARLHPQRKLRDLNDQDLENLYQSIRTTLAAMTEQGGRDVEKDLYGQPGGYRTLLTSKTKGQPCPVCGQPIEQKAYLGGNIYFCPKCQLL
ncbi:MAG: endonuclease VIII [Actinomycetia bacterium]|nr:endonuclease VIII [Actinomycetes bacterium]